MTIFLWALGSLAIFGGFLWWNHRHTAPAGSYPRLYEDNDPEDFMFTGTQRDDEPAKPKKRRKPRRKGYAGHGRIPRTGGF